MFPQCNITFIGWKDEKWVCDFTDRKKVKEHFYRLCGMEPADWSKSYIALDWQKRSAENCPREEGLFRNSFSYFSNQRYIVVSPNKK